MKIQTWVWEKKSKKGNKYWYGYDKENDKKVVLFKNNKDWDNQPAFNVIIEDGDPNYKKDTENNKEQEDVDEVEDDLPF